MVKVITTTKGYKIKVDEEDFNIVSAYKWTVAYNKAATEKHGDFARLNVF